MGKSLGGNKKIGELVIILHHVLLCSTVTRHNQQSQYVVVESCSGKKNQYLIDRLKAYHFCSKRDANIVRSSRCSACLLSAALPFPWVFCLKFQFLLLLVMVVLVGEDILLNFLLPPKYGSGMGISEALKWHGTRSLLTAKWFTKI